MASREPPRPIQQQTYPRSGPTQACFRPQLQFGYFPNKKLALGNPQHELWLESSKARFHQLILHGESQPSNGLLYKVEPPDGETRFAIAYGSAPDKDLHKLLEKIYAKHGEVTFRHHGRDSTGKHFIRCSTKVQPGTLSLPVEKAMICVSSKFEQATVDSFRAREAAEKKRKAWVKAGGKPEKWPPKIPGAGNFAPENLALLPWYKQLPFLTPAAAKALRERMEAQASDLKKKKRGLEDRKQRDRKD